MDTRQAFEAWMYPPLHDPYKRYAQREEDIAWLAWQAATLAERERAAKVCDYMAYANKNTAFLGPEQNCLACAAAIRKG